jgi:hypothetical protein
MDVFMGESSAVCVLEGDPGLSRDVYGWEGRGCEEGVIVVRDLVNFVLCDPE